MPFAIKIRVEGYIWPVESIKFLTIFLMYNLIMVQNIYTPLKFVLYENTHRGKQWVTCVTHCYPRWVFSYSTNLRGVYIFCTMMRLYILKKNLQNLSSITSKPYEQCQKFKRIYRPAIDLRSCFNCNNMHKFT